MVTGNNHSGQVWAVVWMIQNIETHFKQGSQRAAALVDCCFCGGVSIVGTHLALILVVRMVLLDTLTIFASCFFFNPATL